MASILRMPGISADSEEAVLLEWNIANGAEIRSGDVLATVETEKANVDIESDEDGTLWRILAEPGTTVAVGAPIAVLLAVGEVVGDDASVFSGLGIEPAGFLRSAAPPVMPADEMRAEPARTTDEASTSTTLDGQAVVILPPGRIFASPLARRIARDNDISVSEIIGTGPGGRIVRADVELAVAVATAAAVIVDDVAAADPDPKTPSTRSVVEGTATTPPRFEATGTEYTDIPHTGMRRAVARYLTQSKREAPHFYLHATCRVDTLLALRVQINAGSSVRVSINDLVVKAVAKALADVPEMNVIWMDDAVRRYRAVDISVAIQSARGLVTPVIRSAETLSLTQISSQVRDFAERASDGRLKQSELEGGAFTVTNLGMFAVESFSAIINPPQVGILAVGAITQQPIVVNGALEVGSMLTVTVSVDHRPVDGVVAAQWLQRFKTLVENPLLILA